MDTWGILIGIAAAVGVGALLRRRKPAGMGRVLEIVAIVAAGGLSAAAASVGLRYLASSDHATATEQALQVVREAPLVGLVLKENPALEARFREAIEAELRSPTKSGPLRTYVVGAEVRQKLIVPALRNADDATALKAIEAMQDFVKHLQVTNVALCKKFGLEGLQEPNRLDSAGATLFKRALLAQEQAYLSGKARPVAPPQTADQAVSPLLTEAGYTAADFEKLAALATSSDAAGCAVVVKLYAAPTLLPPQRGGILARYLLTVS
ncbi:MAG: hypothetical protein A3D94_13615 [Alphaproteobacteria bacterium RIFCSPHIGHO2_12_FULL_66_14]|nr:MAG: hypothetical protein A3D94_13615 [Alphaproteobacteria bacterium RIFCSPHIGHO2_12_FULL_66_14]